MQKSSKPKCESKVDQEVDQYDPDYEPDVDIPADTGKKKTLDECSDDDLVSFTLEKMGFHFIKVTRLMKTEFGQTFMEGYYSEDIPFKRARELKQKFEALGAKVSIRVI